MSFGPGVRHPDRALLAMALVDQVTQRNASSSEELASTAEEMAAQAETLQQTIAFFKTDGAEVSSAPHANTVFTHLLPRRVSANHSER